MTTKIKRVLISILLAISFILIMFGVVYIIAVYTEYIVIIGCIGVVAEVIYDAL